MDKILQKKKLGIAAALISNCRGSSNRLAWISKLQRYIDVKVYERCGESCPSKINCRQFIAENYYFILSFENSLCLEYTSKFKENFSLSHRFFFLAEKFFATLEHPVVPVVLGQTDYSYFIPSSGYIDTKKFSTIISLAKYLNKTRYDKKKYLSFFINEKKNERPEKKETHTTTRTESCDCPVSNPPERRSQI